MYQPTDEELREIDEKGLSRDFEKVILSFHFINMYKDAVRLKIYKETGNFPKITRSKTGLFEPHQNVGSSKQNSLKKQAPLRLSFWKIAPNHNGLLVGSYLR